MAAKKFVQTLTQYLAGSGVIVGATSIILTSFSDIYGNALALSDFGDKGYGTLEPDSTNEEAFTFTTVTTNANGTVTLGGVSTALAKSPYTETSGLIRAHSGGTKLVISDNVAFWNTFGNINNKQTWADTQTFSVPSVQATNPTLSTQVANKDYVDTTAVAGAPNASITVKGIVQEATQAQVLAKTAAGSTSAELYVNPSTLPSTLLSDYKVDTGAANAYVITPAPAITAYVTGQIFSFKAVNANTTASTLNINGLGTKPIVNSKGGALVANDILAGMLVTVQYDGTSMVMQNPVANTPTAAVAARFGGTGADGALTISSGTTTLALGSASYFEKNYTSISITGTGKLAFSGANSNGTIIVLKSQGAVVLTSSITPMIDCSSLGATSANNGISNINPLINKGVSGSASSTSGAIGAAGVTLQTTDVFAGSLSAGIVRLSTGGAGGIGGTGGTAGTGGTGGGALYIECAGALNFTTTSGISVAGGTGGVGGGSGAVAGGGGGGGGGAGGTAIILYNSLTANTGTITIAGGTGGAGGPSNAGGSGGTGGTGGNGAGGNSNGGTGGTGGAGSPNGGGGGGGGGSDSGGANGSTGGNNTGSATAGGGGGGGASGFSLVNQNNYFF